MPPPATVADYIGGFPDATAPAALERDLAPYRCAKDTVRFLYTEPIPYALITRMAAFLATRHAPLNS